MFKRILKNNLWWLFVVMLSVFLCGCPGVVPGSRVYQPLPQWEARFFAEARKDVFPNDVRKDPNQYAKILVAWSGIITNIEFFNDGSVRVARLTAEHHYFDWIEDFGAQRERFFLSPRSEGSFAVAWQAEAPDERKFIEQFAIGDMLIAYGYPSMIHNEVIGFYPTQNIRAVKPQWYRTDIFDYGRPGEPVKHLKVPF